jgi:predicted membrane channel-forming protein YqfA (hemolysin III family)
MHIRTRKLIGTVALLVLVVVWALLAMGFAQMIGVSHNRLLEIVYYVMAGLGWVLPAMPLISWMSRSDADAQATDEG